MGERRWTQWTQWMTERAVGLAVLCVAVGWLYVFTYSVALNNPNERTRVLQARALAEYGQWHIGETFQKTPKGRLLVRDLYGREHGGQFVNDLGLVCEDPALEPPQCVGKLYPAKAPGASLLGVPALWLAKTVGWVKDGPQDEGKVTWLLRWGGVSVWVLLGLWAMGWLLKRAGVGRIDAARVVLIGGFGTTVFCYGAMFVGHALAGAALVGAVWALERGRARLLGVEGWKDARAWGWAAAGGALAAWAVMAEYHAAVAVLVVAGWVIADRRLWRALPGFAAGSGAVLALFLWSHKVMFGHPLRTGHFFLMSAHNREGQADGFLGIDRFRFEALFDTLFDPYMGLLPLMPWLVVGAWVGIPRFLRGQGLSREPASQLVTHQPASQLAAHEPLNQPLAPSVALSIGAQRALALIPLVYLLFVSMLAKWRVMNGWSLGPRYLVPAMMAALVVAGAGWAHLLQKKPKRAAALTGLAVGSMVVVSALTVVFPQLPSELRNPFVEVAWPLLREGYGVKNLGMALWGAATLTPFFVWLGAASAFVAWPWGAHAVDRARAWRRRALLLALTLGVCWLWLIGMRRWPETPNPKTVEWARQLVRDDAEGWHPTKKRPFWPPGP